MALQGKGFIRCFSLGQYRVTLNPVPSSVHFTWYMYTLCICCTVSLRRQRFSGGTVLYPWWKGEEPEVEVLSLTNQGSSHDLTSKCTIFILERFLQRRRSFLFFIVTTLINNTFHRLQHEDNRVYQTQRLETTCLTRPGSIKKVSL